MTNKMKNEYIELLQDALSRAISYQDYDDQCGRSRYEASEACAKLAEFEKMHC